MKPATVPLRIVSLACLLVLSACGGGGEDEAESSASIDVAQDVSQAETDKTSSLLAPQDDSSAWGDAEGTLAGVQDTLAADSSSSLMVTMAAAAATPTTAQRVAAAGATAQSSTNACSKVRPFYWEIGARDGKLAGGGVGSAAVKPATAISVASASKWLYGAYVAQSRGGALSSSDRKYLAMSAGYGSLVNCSGFASVDACLASGRNGAYTAGLDGVFKYNGGHMEKHASLMGLGALSTKALANEVRAKLGSDIALAYSQPLLAGGAVISTNTYAAFLRKILAGKLQIANQLGSGKVCTNPATCPRAVFAPSPDNESWNYSVGHWVEDDPKVGDGAFSSPGAFGFYPWIDARKAFYGIVARVQEDGGQGSVSCGRLIRAAWASGVAK
ncbi:hypothetical protein CLD22_11400 [Rubrivivax gelatinosus]|nr:hypothetical protein [Rubrivivax gelatinosus]